MVVRVASVAIGIVSLFLVCSCNRTARRESALGGQENCSDPRTFGTYYNLAEKCGNLGPVRPFSGTIALGFENSAFREGGELDYSIVKPRKTDYYLLLPEKYEEKYRQKIDNSGHGNPTILYIEFLGRTGDFTAPTGRKVVLVSRFTHISR